MGVKTFRQLPLAAVFAFAGGFGSAQAAVVDWGVHDTPFKFQSADVSPGTFTDFYLFAVPVGFDLLGSVLVSRDGGAADSISGGTYFVLGAGADTVLGTADDQFFSPLTGFGFDADSGATFNATPGASAGNYAYVVTGSADGTQGGHYGVTSYIGPAVVMAVPELETYALILVGLGVLGALAGGRAARAPA